jgi:multiple sugar transport system permease protein
MTMLELRHTEPGTHRALSEQDATQQRPVPPRKPLAQRARHAGTVLFFLLPSAIPLLLFTLVPLGHAAWISLHDWNLIAPMQWVGVDNYRDALTDDRTRAAFGHTLYFVAGYLPLVYVGGLAAALALNRVLKGRNLFRTIYFLPVVTSWVVVALTWKWLLNPSTGLVNTMLDVVGIDGPGWWTDPNWAMPSVILATAWKDLGFVMVILLAGLQAIPQEYVDATRVDGAGPWQRLRHLTLPLLSPSTFFVVVLSLINGFQVFDQIYVMTGGGPGGATEVVVQQIYDLTFRYGRAGDAAALSMLLFVVILVVTTVQNRAEKRWVHHG